MTIFFTIVNAAGLQFPEKVQGLKPYSKAQNITDSSSKPSSSGRNKGIVSTDLVLHSSEHPKLDFVGTESTEDADSQLKHYIAVIDAEKKTWQFIEVRRMTLRSTVKKRNVNVADEGSDNEDGADGTTVCILSFFVLMFPLQCDRRRDEQFY